ncbi:Mannosyltransferase [groundwater metagenome]|uniref:Mannosyltransferase n=1 Tax=groundwater metagenome TaxID=717931 RepID=A0A098E5U9_9ZZZZ
MNKKMDANFITGIKADRSYGFSVYERDIYEGIKDKVNFNIISMNSLNFPVGRTLSRNLSLYFLYTIYLKLKIKNDAIKHITTQKNAFVLNVINPEKSIVTCHDIIPHMFNEFSGVRRFLFDLSVKGMRKADKIIAVSESTKRDLINYLNFPEDKIKVVYESINTDKFKPADNAREKLKKKGFDFGDGRIILYVGLDKPTKNIPELIKAFYKLKKVVTDVKLIKVGGYEWKSERIKILDLIKDLNLEKDILFFENVSGEVLPLFYSASDVFVFPSLYEGFGLPPLEAMACGCPVIASNKASIPEVVGDAGILVEPDEDNLFKSMFNLLKDKRLIKELSKKGLEQAKKFSLEKECEETLKIYEKLR